MIEQLLIRMAISILPLALFPFALLGIDCLRSRMRGHGQVDQPCSHPLEQG